MLLLAVAFSWAAAGGAQAQTSPPASLQGTFAMTGVVTVAHHVPGERVGQQVTRTWTFTPLCPTAPCTTVRVIRTRITGTDTVILKEQTPDLYTGKGRFYLPLRCAGRLYRPGELVPFKVTVRVTGTTVVNGTLVATSIAATYRNRTRKNLTPCVAVLGHDAASYSGTLQPPPA